MNYLLGMKPCVCVFFFYFFGDFIQNEVKRIYKFTSFVGRRPRAGFYVEYTPRWVGTSGLQETK